MIKAEITAWEQISPADRDKINAILDSLAADGKLVDGCYANFTELADRLGKKRHTVQRHLQALPDDSWQRLRARKVASAQEAEQIGIPGRGWRYKWLYQARETLAVVIWLLAKHEDAIASNRSVRHTICPKRSPAA